MRIEGVAKSTFWTRSQNSVEDLAPRVAEANQVAGIVVGVVPGQLSNPRNPRVDMAPSQPPEQFHAAR